MELLKSLYEIHSPSNGEKKMKRFIRRWITENVPDAVVWAENGNVYAKRGDAETYPCVVAHTDQVQERHAKDFVVLESNGVMMGYSPSKHEQQGLGADDKNGIWVALKCLQKYEVMKCAFFYGEEVGCLGSERADMAFFADCRFCIQCDRRNGGDLITDVWGQMCSDEFLYATGYEMFGYKPTHGLMTDVATLKSNGMKCSAVNLSCGYYEPHTDHEFTDVAELVNCLDFVQHIIANCTSKYDYDMPAKKSWGGGGKLPTYYDWDDDYGWYGNCWQGQVGKQTSVVFDNDNNDVYYKEYDRQVDEVYELMEWAVVDEGYQPFDLDDFIVQWGANYPILARFDFERIYNDVLNVMCV